MQIKHYPFEVKIAGSCPSVALADQIRSLNWIVSKAHRKGMVSTAELADVRAKLLTLVEGLK